MEVFRHPFRVCVSIGAVEGGLNFVSFGRDIAVFEGRQHKTCWAGIHWEAWDRMKSDPEAVGVNRDKIR